MPKLTVYVGLDYHKDSIQVRVMDHSVKILADMVETSVPGSRPAPGRPTSPTSWPPPTTGPSTWPAPGSSPG